MPREALNRHIWRCRLIKRGLQPDRFALLPSSAPAYANATGVVSFLSGHGEHAVQHLTGSERRTLQPTLAMVSQIEEDEFRLMGPELAQRARTIGEYKAWTSSWEVRRVPGAVTWPCLTQLAVDPIRATHYPRARPQRCAGE